MRKSSDNRGFLDRTQLPGAPENLKRYGRALWAKVQSEYEIRDSGGLEMLGQACAAADRAEECAARIKADGLIVVSGSGTSHDHPLLRHELAARAFVVKTLRGLGLNVEPLRRGPGRPPASVPLPAGLLLEGEDDEWDETHTN